MALPDDGRLDLADLVTVGNAISAIIAPPFKAGSFGLNLVQSQNFPTDTNVIKWRKRSALTASTVAEGAVYTPSDSNSQSVVTSVSTTAAKVVVGSTISAESVRFGAGSAEVPQVATLQGQALARSFDVALFALIDSLTNAATATSTFDQDTLLTGQYNVYNSECPVGPLVAIITQKQLMELKKVVASSGAAVFSNQSRLDFLDGAPAANGYAGNYLGTDVYAIADSYLSATGGDKQGAIFNPQWCFAAGLGGAAESMVYQTGAGVASQIPGLSTYVLSWLFFDVKVWNNTAGCELRSDS